MDSVPHIIPGGIRPDPIPADYRPREARVRAREETRHHRKVVRLRAAEMFDARLSRVYFTELSELPDGVRQYPEYCQRAFMATFNNWLAKCGETGKAFFAANKALDNARRQLAARAKRERDNERRRLETDFDVDRLRPLRPQIVVP